jgi:hypothetical protein
VARIICVAGPYHGRRMDEVDDSKDRIVLDGAHGPKTYLLRRRPTPNVAIYVSDGATEPEILQSLADLVPAS